jgi:hypothetical protein
MPSDIENALIQSDPFSKNLTKRLLAGVKISTNKSCAPAIQGDTAVLNPTDITPGARRDESMQICSYYTNDPERQVTGVEHDFGSMKFNFKKAPASEQAWINDVGEFHGTCAGDYNNYKYLYFNQKKYDGNKGEPVHSVFVWDNGCPKFAEPMNPSHNLNAHCNGSPRDFRLCKQTTKSALDCCLGLSTNCRSDQVPQSTFCDNYVSAYCQANPTSPHCTCIGSIPPEANKYNITAGPECWYAPCVDNIKGTDPEQRSYVTNIQLKKISSKGCPAINIVDCSQVGNTVFVKGMNFVDANNQNCSINTDGSGQNQLIKGDAGKDSTKPVQTKTRNLWIMGGVGVVFFVLILIIAMS